MKHRERAIQALMDEHVTLLRGFADPVIMRSALGRAYDAGAAATAYELGTKAGSAIAEYKAQIDVALARAAELEQLVHWMARTVHQAHHQDDEDGTRTWQECQRGFCSSVRRGLGAGPIREETFNAEGKEGE